MSSTGSVRPEHTSLPMRDHDNLVKDKYAAQYELRKVRPHVETEPGVAKASQNTCQLAEAGRGWPRLAEAGGRPELDLGLAGRIKPGGRSGRGQPLGGGFPHRWSHIGVPT